MIHILALIIGVIILGIYIMGSEFLDGIILPLIGAAVFLAAGYAVGAIILIGLGVM